MGRKDKKERHRLKRLERHAQLRRLHSGSPYRKIGQAGQVVACYINANWKTEGMGSLMVLRAVPSGGYAMASFLIDTWCVGLKEAWGRINATREEFDDAIDHQRESGLVIERIDPDMARRLVAGAIRFSTRNGFRLPHRYERWTAILGGVGDWRLASLQDFGTEDGTLCYVGTEEFLHKRLIGCTPQQFLARKDVHFLMGGPVSGFDDQPDAEAEEHAVTEEEFEGVMSALRKRWLDAARRWCFAEGQQPHPRLGDALDLTLAAMLQVPADEHDDTDAASSIAAENLDRFLDIEDPRAAAELREAMLQVQEFVAHFDSPKAMAKALRLESLDEPF